MNERGFFGNLLHVQLLKNSHIGEAVFVKLCRSLFFILCLSPKHPDVLGFASSEAAQPVVGAAQSGPEEVERPRHVQTPGPHMETSFQGEFSGCTLCKKRFRHSLCS